MTETNKFEAAEAFYDTLSDESKDEFDSLLGDVHDIFDETASEREAWYLDGGFYYDYGDITNAWHSDYQIQFDEDFSTEFTLDVPANWTWQISKCFIDYVEHYHSKIPFRLSEQVRNTKEYVEVSTTVEFVIEKGKKIFIVKSTI